MFTGLIQDIGTIVSVRAVTPGATLSVRSAELAKRCGIGASVAVDGVCLTVSAPPRESVLCFDVSSETLARSSLDTATVGQTVNLEPALRIGEALGGHFVLGHVDGTGRVLAHTRRGDNLEVQLEGPPEVTALLVPKGSVAVDGISLTVNAIEGQRFTVNLVPHTLRMVTLGGKPIGARVNLEGDVLVKAVARLLGQSVPGGVRSSGEAILAWY